MTSKTFALPWTAAISMVPTWWNNSSLQNQNSTYHNHNGYSKTYHYSMIAPENTTFSQQEKYGISNPCWNWDATLEIAQEKVPKQENQFFLLKINFTYNTTQTLESNAYWIIAMEAALTAHQRETYKPGGLSNESIKKWTTKSPAERRNLASQCCQTEDKVRQEQSYPAQQWTHIIL